MTSETGGRDLPQFSSAWYEDTLPQPPIGCECILKNDFYRQQIRRTPQQIWQDGESLEYLTGTWCAVHKNLNCTASREVVVRSDTGNDDSHVGHMWVAELTRRPDTGHSLYLFGGVEAGFDRRRSSEGYAPQPSPAPPRLTGNIQ